MNTSSSIYRKSAFPLQAYILSRNNVTFFSQYKPMINRLYFSQHFVDILYKKYSTEATSDAAVNTTLPFILLNFRQKFITGSLINKITYLNKGRQLQFSVLCTYKVMFGIEVLDYNDLNRTIHIGDPTRSNSVSKFYFIFI